MQHFQEPLQTSRPFGAPSDLLAVLPTSLHSFRRPCSPSDVLAFLLTFGHSFRRLDIPSDALTFSLTIWCSPDVLASLPMFWHSSRCLNHPPEVLTIPPCFDSSPCRQVDLPDALSSANLSSVLPVPSDPPKVPPRLLLLLWSQFLILHLQFRVPSPLASASSV